MNELDIVDRLSIHRTMSQYLTIDQLIFALNCDRAGAKAEIVRLRAELSELRAKAEAKAELTSSYVQEVPDRCDRIVWRNSYYHLPISPPAQAASLTTPTLNASCVPDGWKLVPIEPTEEMRNAGRDAHCDAEDRIMREAALGNKGMLLRANRAAHVYAGMLAAAPSPTGLDNQGATKSNDKHTFVFPDASMTKIRYIFVDGEMVYENLESEQ